jgi:glycerophosphoryl diester phosphodiesterase
MVVIHDAELDRTTDARKRWRHVRVRVANKTAAEIQSLEAGNWFAPKFSGTKIPLLAEALDTIQKGSVTLIERKAGDPAACIKLLREKHLINKVIVQSFDWEYLRAFHQEEPRQILAALGPPTLMPGGRRPLRLHRDLSARRLRQLQQCGASIAVWNRSVSKRAVQRAHAHGLKVWVYTVSDPRLATRLLAKGVDGLITNNPPLIWRTIALRQ